MKEVSTIGNPLCGTFSKVSIIRPTLTFEGKTTAGELIKSVALIFADKGGGAEGNSGTPNK